ncbi:hypothetical protein HNQ07_003367 [Deinococcus metalli]|uniref:DUF5666 domain-containing protein n=1 Tax=Deinococcus metalli TaxID=1141878 RepID=A0A7W8KGU4_9DEIO|nr:hypothetical protein [Deinococcus metalli]MBB5377867.1 hypothetical protein [Deinococcus metalli]GHF55383.1 hypothetical protein GCM10017781_34670 [Deinococcus metalli]
MKRALLPLTALALVGCAAPAAPTPTVELLGAPTTLNIGGTAVTAQATPSVQGGTFSVLVRLTSNRPPVPNMTVTGVYVVTGSGVWKGAVGADQRAACARNACVLGTAAGGATGLRAGQTVQVVARVQDARGRALWLRAPEVKISDGT